MGTELYQPVCVQPVAESIEFAGVARHVLKVEVTGHEYDLCERSSHDMWANKKTGEWGSGLANTEKDPHKAERIGRLGDMALAKITGTPIDLAYRVYGDDRDTTLLKNVAVNVKTACRKPSYNAGLVKAVDATGQPTPLRQDVYVFGYVEREDRQAKMATVVFVGVETKDNILGRPKVRARKGSHLNYEIPYADLKAMPKFFELYRRARGTR